MCWRTWSSAQLSPWAAERAGADPSAADGQFLGDHLEIGELGAAEGVGDGHVSGVAAAGDQHPADARGVVAGVEGVPAAAEIDPEPSAEVHHAGDRHADVAEIAG